MKKIVERFGSGRLMTVAALFGLALLVALAVPFVASADEPGGDRPQRPQPTVEACRERVSLDDPRRDGFFDELVTDGVISADQAADIDARLDARHFDGCVARILWERGNALATTAAATGAEMREVVGALVAGQSLSEFARAGGVDNAALVAAIMATPAHNAAALVADGQVTQSEIDRILASLEARAIDRIHASDIAPRQCDGQFDFTGDRL